MQKVCPRGFVHSFKSYSYNPGQDSYDTNAIARQNEVFSLSPSPRCSVDVLHSSFVSTQSTLLRGEGDSRNRLLQQHTQAFLRGRIWVHLPKCVFVPNLLVSQDVLTRVLVRNTRNLQFSIGVNGFKLTLCGIHNLSNLSAESVTCLCCQWIIFSVFLLCFFYPWFVQLVLKSEVRISKMNIESWEANQNIFDHVCELHFFFSMRTRYKLWMLIIIVVFLFWGNNIVCFRGCGHIKQM